MKLTQKQIEKFEAVRDKFISDIDLFSAGIDFSEKVTETETRRKQWITVLKSRVNNLTAEDISNMSNLDAGFAIAEYLYKIKEVLLGEFSKEIVPFDTIISKYYTDIYCIFIMRKP